MPATNELLQEGRYRINQQLPLDGAGIVYQAYDTVRATDVVVKEIAVRLNRVTTISQQETLKVNFANQARILTGIEHDSVLHVHDFFSEIGRQFLVMESVDGDDLADLLERNRNAFAVSDVVDWADQLLDALNYLHTFSPPIVHRNIRPRNINLGSGGKIKLLAIGIADGGEQNLTTNLREDAAANAVNYSPLEIIWDGLDPASQKVIANSYDDRSERILKEPADARSDIYSLGATLYHLITGKMPADPLERSIELLDGNPDPLKAPHKVDPEIPVELSEVLMRSLEIKRENRFDSAVIMRQVVRTAMVRAHEREAEDMREANEAAEELRMVAELGLVTARRAAEEAQKEALAAQERIKAEQLEIQAREAEALRQDEERAAAAEAETLRIADEQRLLREQEAADAVAAEEARKAAEEAAERAKAEEDEWVEAQAREAQVQAQAEADEAARLQAEAEAAIASDATADDAGENELTVEKLLDPQELLELDAAIASSVRIHESEAPEMALTDENVGQGVAEVVAYEAVAAEAAVPEPAGSPEASYDVELGGIFAQDAEPKKGMNMALVAGIAVVLLIVAAGLFFMMSSNSTPPGAAVQAEPPAAPVQPVQAAAVPETNTKSNTAEPEVTPSETAETPAYSASVPSRTAAQPAAKPKKAEAAPKPAPGKKKAVTVDDLINDN